MTRVISIRRPTRSEEATAMSKFLPDKDFIDDMDVVLGIRYLYAHLASMRQAVDQLDAEGYVKDALEATMTAIMEAVKPVESSDYDVDFATLAIIQQSELTETIRRLFDTIGVESSPSEIVEYMGSMTASFEKEVLIHLGGSFKVIRIDILTLFPEQGISPPKIDEYSFFLIIVDDSEKPASGDG